MPSKPDSQREHEIRQFIPSLSVQYPNSDIEVLLRQIDRRNQALRYAEAILKRRGEFEAVVFMKGYLDDRQLPARGSERSESSMEPTAKTHAMEA